MNLSLSEEQLLLKNLVERFVEQNGKLDSRGHSLPLRASADGWRQMADLGLLALPFPERDGGLGGGLVELTTVMEGLGRGLLGEPMLSGLLVAGSLLDHAGTEAQRNQWLPRIMSGQSHLALAHFEHEARFDLSHVRTTATRSADGIRLNGIKTFVIADEVVDAFILSGRENGDAGDAEGIGFFIVPFDAVGLERRRYRLVDGSSAFELRLHDVSVPPSAALARSFDAFSRVVETATLAASAEMLGIMNLLFDATLDYVRTRKQFGVPIGRFQALQHRMADLYVGLEQSRSMVQRASLTDRSDRRAWLLAVKGAKAYVSEAAIKLGHEAIQLHGGMGTTDELVIGHGHKRLLLLSMLFGDAESMLQDYARIAA